MGLRAVARPNWRNVGQIEDKFAELDARIRQLGRALCVEGLPAAFRGGRWSVFRLIGAQS